MTRVPKILATPCVKSAYTYSSSWCVAFASSPSLWCSMNVLVSRLLNVHYLSCTHSGCSRCVHLKPGVVWQAIWDFYSHDCGTPLHHERSIARWDRRGHCKGKFSSKVSDEPSLRRHYLQQNRADLFYPLVATTEFLCVVLFMVPGLVPSKQELVEGKEGGWSGSGSQEIPLSGQRMYAV